VQLENIIVKEKDQQSAAEMVYGTNPKRISNMRTLGEMAIIARHSDKKIRSKLADRGNTVMIVLYSNIHEKDVYQFMNIAAKKTMFSRDVIWLNKTYSQNMGISPVDYVSSDVEAEDEDMEEEEAYELEG
jgi:UDP-3-O-[3-hydroxymyristoyl] glucosamine N-acyltransferase